MSDGSDDYDVGFRKPPAKHQFQKGQSGNPSGKPKKPPKVGDVLARALAKKIWVTVDGKKQKMTKLELLVETVVNKAVKGDTASQRIVLSEAALLGAQSDPQPSGMTAHELEIFKELYAASLKGAEGGA